MASIRNQVVGLPSDQDLIPEPQADLIQPEVGFEDIHEVLSRKPVPVAGSKNQNLFNALAPR